MTEPSSLDVEAVLAQEGFMRALARSLLGASDVDDAVQRGLWRAVQAPPARAGALRGFVRRMVLNLAANERRAVQRRLQHERGAAREERLPSAAEMAEQAELRQRIAAAVVALDEPYRTTIWLRFYDDLAVDAVARRMDVPRETARTRLRRGLERLRAQLRTEDDARWTRALLACAALPNSAPTLAPWLGVLAMSTKQVVVGAAALGAVLLVCIPLALRARPSTPPAGAGGPSALSAAGDAGPLPEAMRTPLAVPVRQAEATLRGTLRFADGRPAAGLAYRPWGERLPYWAQLHDRAKACAAQVELGDALPSTDDAGRWQAAAGTRALSFRVTPGLVASFALADGADPDLTLPALARLEVAVEGTRSEESCHVSVRAHPAHSAAVIAAPTPRGPVCVAILECRLEPDAGAPVAVDVLAGWEHRMAAHGTGLEFVDWSRNVVAPASVVFRVGGRRPITEVRVVERAGGAPLPVGGGVVFSDPEEPSEHRRDAPLLAGCARLDASFEPESTWLLRVLLDDGELIERRIACPETGAFGVIELVRGSNAELLRARLPADASRPAKVVFVAGDGKLTFAVPHETKNVLLGARPVWLRDASGGVRIADPTEDWQTLLVVTDDGRAATAERSAELRDYATAWLPDRALAPIETVALHAADGAPADGEIKLQLGVPSPRGDQLWVTLRSLQFDATTTAWPTWEVRAPVGWETRTRLYVWPLIDLDDPVDQMEPAAPPPAQPKRR